MAINSYLSLTGDDAFENEFQVVLPAFPGSLDPVGISLRAIRVTTPELAYEPYKVHYKTEDADKPSGKQSTQKTITISFRIDKNYTAYKSFVNWHRIIHDPQFGTASRDYEGGVSLIRVPITILQLDANGIPTSSPEVYNGCMIGNIPGRSLTYESGQPIILDIPFTYIDMIPMS